MIQYGTIYRSEHGWSSIEDTTEYMLESAIRSAMWQRRANKDVLNVFELDTDTGEMSIVMDRDAILSMEAEIPESDWHYFHSARNELPLPVLRTKKITGNVLKLSPQVLAEAAE